MRPNVAREQSPLIALREPLQKLLEPNLIDERLGNRPPHNTMSTGDIVKEIGRLQLGLEAVQRLRQLIRNDRPRFGALQPGVLLPDTEELVGRVLRDLGLDILDIVLVESARLSILEDHEVGVLIRRQSKAGQDFQR